MAKGIDVGVVTHAGGAHLDAYFQALADTPEVRRVALADPDGASVKLAREILEQKYQGLFPDVGAMLQRQRPQMALVSMEPALAPPAIERCLDAGCHVLTEKPACVRAEDFARLARQAQSKHLHLMLALANRPHPSIREARRIVHSGKLGRLYGIDMHLVADQERLTREDYRSTWRSVKARAGGGHLIWLGIHWLDAALFITGLKVAAVSGFAGVVGGQPIDVEDSAAVALRFDNGIFGTLTSGFYLGAKFERHIQRYQSHLQIWGEDGWVRLATFEEGPVEWYSRREPGPPRVQSFDYPRGRRSYQPFVRAAVRAAADLDEPPITAEECLHVLQAIFAFYQAAETGTVQNVS